MTRTSPIRLTTSSLCLLVVLIGNRAHSGVAVQASRLGIQYILVAVDVQVGQIVRGVAVHGVLDGVLIGWSLLVVARLLLASLAVSDHRHYKTRITAYRLGTCSAQLTQVPRDLIGVPNIFGSFLDGIEVKEQQHRPHVRTHQVGERLDLLVGVHILQFVDVGELKVEEVRAKQIVSQFLGAQGV